MPKARFGAEIFGRPIWGRKTDKVPKFITNTDLRAAIHRGKAESAFYGVNCGFSPREAGRKKRLLCSGEKWVLFSPASSTRFECSVRVGTEHVKYELSAEWRRWERPKIRARTVKVREVKKSAARNRYTLQQV